MKAKHSFKMIFIRINLINSLDLIKAQSKIIISQKNRHPFLQLNILKIKTWSLHFKKSNIYTLQP